MTLTGRCLCGEVSYVAEGPPLFVFLCHCRDCQRSGGSLVHFGVMVPEGAFMRRGHVSAYVKRSDGGRDITREFCSVCGSGIDNRLARVPGVVVIKGGTLDEPSLVAPSFELYTRSKAACFGTNDELTSFDGDLTVDPATLAWKAPGRA